MTSDKRSVSIIKLPKARATFAEYQSVRKQLAEAWPVLRKRFKSLEIALLEFGLSIDFPIDPLTNITQMKCFVLDGLEGDDEGTAVENQVVFCLANQSPEEEPSSNYYRLNFAVRMAVGFLVVPEPREIYPSMSQKLFGTSEAMISGLGEDVDGRPIFHGCVPDSSTLLGPVSLDDVLSAFLECVTTMEQQRMRNWLGFHYKFDSDIDG
jgi:hypothetical protein